MKLLPSELIAARRAVQESYCWRRKGQTMDSSAYAALNEKERATWRWEASPDLVEHLVAAERRFSNTFPEKSMNVACKDLAACPGDLATTSGLVVADATLVDFTPGQRPAVLPSVESDDDELELCF